MIWKLINIMVVFYFFLAVVGWIIIKSGLSGTDMWGFFQ